MLGLSLLAALGRTGDFACPEGTYAKGLQLDFSTQPEIVNNLGGYAGGRDAG